MAGAPNVKVDGAPNVDVEAAGCSVHTDDLRPFLRPRRYTRCWTTSSVGFAAFEESLVDGAFGEVKGEASQPPIGAEPAPE